MNPITLPNAELRPALAGLGKVLNRHASLPVLHHVRIERSTEGWVTLSVTDLDRFLSVRLEQPDQGDAIALLVPHEDLLKLSKSCSRDERLTVEPAPAQAAQLKFALAGQLGQTLVSSPPVSEFPVIPRINADPITLSEHLRSSIHQALECASSDDTRFVLQGALLDTAQPDAHYVVGTDGRHLYSANSFRLPLKDSVIIPAHKFLAWKEFNNDGGWQLCVGRSSKDTPPMVQLASRRWTFLSRQIEGVYPRWQAALPSLNEVCTSIDFDPATTDQLMALIQKMPCHDDQHSTLGVRCVDDRVFLVGKPPEATDWTTVEVPGATGKGTPMTVFFNRHFLLKALRFGLHHLDLINERSPLRFSHEGRQMTVMPLRVSAPTKALAPVPSPPQPEPTPPMLHNSTPEGSASSDATPPPTLDDAIAMVEGLKDTLQTSLTGLKELSLKLKSVQRDQRTSARELQSFRSTLRTLQNVKL